jgi:hypothetical protein
VNVRDEKCRAAVANAVVAARIYSSSTGGVMTRPALPDKARITIDASSSKLFPVHSIVSFERIYPDSARVRLFIERDGGEPEELFEADLPEVSLPDADAAIRGPLNGNGRPLKLVITLCTGEDPKLGPRYFVGQILETSGGVENPGGTADPGGTGVWVSEERPPGDPPDKS